MNNKKKSLHLLEYKEIRCPGCRLIAFQISKDAVGVVLLQCRKCKQTYTIDIQEELLESQ